MSLDLGFTIHGYKGQSNARWDRLTLGKTRMWVNWAVSDASVAHIFIIMEIRTITQTQVKKAIKRCEGKHIQQIAYSSYHDALTQICFGCGMVRTSLKPHQIKSEWGAQ